MRIMAFADEFLALRHAKFVLLVNDDESKVVRGEPGLDQSGRANGQKCGVRSAECGMDRASTFGIERLMFDVRRFPAAGPQFHANSQPAKPFTQRPKMLLRQKTANIEHQTFNAERGG